MGAVADVFESTPLDLVRRRYPDFPGPVDVYRLQRHIIDGVLEPLIARYIDGSDLVIDLGCGSGYWVRRLALRANRAVGVDEDDRAFHLRPDLQLLKSSVYSLPFEDAVADAVTSRWVFEHLADPPRAIAEMYRVLKPDGVALVVTPNKLHPGMIVSNLLPLRAKRSLLRALGDIEEETVFETYYRANTRRTLDRLFVETGFERLHFEYVKDPSYWLFSQTLFRLLARRGRRAGRGSVFSMDMVALYRKRRVARRASTS